jgi:putative endonuclease
MPAFAGMTVLGMSYFVYIMANRKNGALYIGVTNDLFRRNFEHKNRAYSGFTSKYEIDKLVYYETYPTILEAIAREKQIKRWKREWKIDRIKEMNPDWKDLSLTLNQ